MRIVRLFLALASLAWAQEALTNDSIVKMAKAGLSGNLIVSVIRSQPGKYSVTPEDLARLKRQGISDLVCTAMVSKSKEPGLLPSHAPTHSPTPPSHSPPPSRPAPTPESEFARSQAASALRTGLESSRASKLAVATAAPTIRVTTRSFLTPLRSEGSGYGLYSYILFGARPDSLASDRWRRYFQTILAYWSLPISDEVLRYVPPERMNLTFLPITCYARELPSDTVAPFRFDQERVAMHRTEHQAAGNSFLYHDSNDVGVASSANGAACILVSSYDYARAQVLLSLFGGSHMEGPYIISTTEPLSKRLSLPDKYLYQDLSSVPADLIPLWVKEFMAQAQEQEFWKTRTKEQFILRLRTAIEIASRQIPDFASAVTWTLAGPSAQP
jgi:hypothetical protein